MYFWFESAFNYFDGVELTFVERSCVISSRENFVLEADGWDEM